LWWVEVGRGPPGAQRDRGALEIAAFKPAAGMPKSRMSAAAAAPAAP
jgi:hypothetical protein